ncbi:MAG: hypothetical protein HY645_14925 [Acidobacteria bacterium]|nr:hypothetical protein [Acidobacteriota bacterium]
MKPVEDISSIRRKEAESAPLEFVFERVVVPIPSRFMSYVDSLEAKLARLEAEMQTLRLSVEPAIVDDTIAEALVVSYIGQARQNKRMEINAFEAAHSLRLPIDQVLKVLRQLKRRGVKEVK